MNLNLNQAITQLRAQYAVLGETLENLAMGVGSPGRRNITNIRRITNHPRLRAPTNAASRRTSSTAPHTRTLSPAGRRAIARAQKVRWAKMKASKLQVVERGKKAA